jgi:hypothetical protein
MGLIRKTTSIATLGIVPFRSRKELLRRAERAHRTALTELDHEKELREQADRRVTDAERRREVAELQALAAAERSAKAKAKATKAKRRHRRETAEQVRAEAGKLGRRARAEAKRAAQKAEEETRRTAKEARKAAKSAKVKTKAAAHDVRAAVEPQLEKGLDRARELGHDAVEATGSVVTEVREKVRRGGGRRRPRR